MIAVQETIGVWVGFQSMETSPEIIESLDSLSRYSSPDSTTLKGSLGARSEMVGNETLIPRFLRLDT